MVFFIKAAGANCAAGASTLTTGGCTACGEYNLCRGFSLASDCVGPNCKTDGNCTFECLTVDAASPTLVVLVEFGDYQSAQEVEANFSNANLTGYPDETSDWPSVSNDQVDTLGTIELSPQVTTLIVSGGTALSEYPKGKVSRISLTESFIYLETEVTKVALHNLDLGTHINLLPDYLPSSVKTLDLSNTLLQAFPTELGNMASLQRLLLDYNYLSTLSAEDVISSITTLSLENNNINTFEATFQDLEYLNLAGNKFSSRYFTTAQVTFLRNLDTLGLSESDFQVAVGCDESEQSLLNGVTVCLSDPDASDSIGGESDAPGSTHVDGLDSATPGSPDTTFTRMAVGIVFGVSALALIGVFVFTAMQNKKKKTRDRHPNMNATIEYPGDHPSSPDRSIRQLKKMHSSRYASSGRVKGVARYSSNVSVGLPTSSYGDDSLDIPVLEASSISSKYASVVSTMHASIWNDYELLSLQLSAGSIRDVKPLGSGGYATVWLVRYKNLQLLASKRLRSDKQSKKNIAAFVEEIKLVANFDHPHIVQFIGAAWTAEHDLQMILEYMDGGDLRRYLSSPRTPTGWTHEKFGVAISIIEALLYLHSFVPPLLHRDLKSKNVLLSAGFKAKLSDFGKSRFRSDDNTMSGGVGTSRWLAPEVIRGDTDYDDAADIYSFGVLLTELDTNKIPYNNTRGPNGKALSDTTIVHRVASGRLYPKLRASCERTLKDLVAQCIAEDPSKRPTASEVARELREIQQEMAASLSKRAPWTTDFIGRGVRHPK
ncbi:putative serine/threonine-protein kinase/receptor [Phytophthora citrophthora]|uniref:Serine/threonine-protein kinase/receptor n=1 Tax=Phytophthora citrophthora TaxID=4793 RepID=A0AAD9LLH7_9STRA|nr:putative serine/threonine-protein kinase/receptor [Phytophthora citrophthora]